VSLVVPFEEIFESKEGTLANHPSWERVELGASCDIINGFPFKSGLFNKTRGCPIVRIRDLSKGSTETFFDGSFPSEYLVRNGDLLIGMDGIFRCVEWSGGEAGLNQRVCKIIPNESCLDRRFLAFGLNGYLKAIEEATSSVTVGHLSSRDILRIPFPLPPLAEQRRIVAKLEALLGKVDDCRKRFDKVPVLLKRFRQSVLAVACSGRLTADWRSNNSDINIEDVLPTRLGDALVQIKTGPFGSALHKSDYVTDGVPIVNPMHINDGRITPTKGMSITRSKALELSEYLLKAGDVVIGRRGEMGRCAMVGLNEAGWLCGTGTMILRASAMMLPEYLQRFLSSPSVIHALEADAVGTTMVNLNQGILSGLELYLPSVLEQHEIVRRVEALSAVADQIETRYAKAKGYVDRLTQSILAKAFRGELVPQDRSDEPASALLERNRAQRASAVAAPATRNPCGGATAPTTLEPAMPPARRGRQPKVTLTSFEISASKGEQAEVSFSKPARNILKRMKSGREYARADLADALGLSVTEWNACINELKDAGLVVQSGERRGARYRIEE
jgi:type I restriction enzyme S subunit